MRPHLKGMTREPAVVALARQGNSVVYLAGAQRVELVQGLEDALRGFIVEALPMHAQRRAQGARAKPRSSGYRSCADAERE